MASNSDPKFVELFDIILHEPALRELFSELGIYVVDYKGKRTLTNKMWKELGFDDRHSYEDTWIQFLHPEDKRRVESNRDDAFAGSEDFVQDVYRIQDSRGEWRWVSNRSGIALRDADGKPWIRIGVGDDLTRIKAAQEEASQRAREAGTLNATIEVISSSLNLNETVERILEQALRVVPYDRATVQVLHEGQLEVLGGAGFQNRADWENLKFPYPEDGSLSTRAIQERRPWMSNDVSVDFPKYIQVDRKELIRSWIGAPLIAHGDVIGLIAFDSTKPNFYNSRHIEMARAFAGPVAIALENARMHGETYKLAMEDALTGIGSRHAFDLNSRFLFEKARREGRELALAMLDLDRFKDVNDDFGHPVGDKVLQAISKTCESGLRSTDLIARYGGEEIVILFPDTSVNLAAEIVERIRREVSTLTYEGVNRSVTISAGISGCRPNRQSTLAETIREADGALYRAKADGRNRIAVHQK